MRPFIIKVCVFLVPVFFIVLIPAVVLMVSHESFSALDPVLKSKERHLIGYAYHDSNYRYLKWASIQLNPRKDIWALGSSRVLQFRENMFDSTFYNAGYTVRSLNDFIPFLKSLPREKYPKYMVLGLDHWMFSKTWDDPEIIPNAGHWTESFVSIPKASTYFKMYIDLIKGKYRLNAFKKDKRIRKIGLNAVVNNYGFRNDGTMCYGEQIAKLVANDSTAHDFRYAETYEKIRTGYRQFKPGDSLNPKGLNTLNEILQFCKANNIIVVGFLPPFADSVYDRMIQTGKLNYVKEIFQAIEPEFKALNFELHDFSTMALCGSSDKEAIDGLHGGELTYQRLLIKMLDSGSILNKVVDKGRLNRDLENTENNYIVYSY